MAMDQQPVPSEQKPNAAAPAGGKEILTEADQLKHLFKEYGQPVLIGLALALAIVLGFGAYKNYKQTSLQKAFTMLGSAKDSEQLQQVINQYPSTPAAPIATLTLASEYFAAGQYDMAQNAYFQFIQKYPKHPMKEAAELGKAQCLEAGGQFEQAEAGFTALVAANPKSYLVPLATLGKGRCLEKLGKFEEAKAVYEDYLAANPESGWEGHIKSALSFVDKDMRAAQKPVTVAPASTKASPAPASTAPEIPLQLQLPSAGTPSR